MLVQHCSGPSYAMLYTFTKEKGSNRKLYVHVIIDGGDPAVMGRVLVLAEGYDLTHVRIGEEWDT